MLDPGVGAVRALPGAPAERLGPVSARLPWRLIILASALVGGLLIAIGETGKWDLIPRFVYQVPYGQSDPLFNKDIGFYLFSLPVYVALKNWMLLILFLSALIAGAVYFIHGEIDDHLDRIANVAGFSIGLRLGVGKPTARGVGVLYPVEPPVADHYIGIAIQVQERRYRPNAILYIAMD